MNLKDIIGRWYEARKLEGVVFLCGLALLGGGWWWINGGNHLWGRNEVKVWSENERESEMISVDVGGAVVRPGVYQLSGNARVIDALQAAGGLSDQSDNKWIETNLNRAQKLTDGQKIYIPEKKTKNQELENSKQNTSYEKKIDINTASAGELDKLPGVGEVTAGKIISGRPYASIEELKDRKILSLKVFEQIKLLISVW